MKHKFDKKDEPEHAKEKVFQKTLCCGKAYGIKEHLLGFAIGAVGGFGVGFIMFRQLIAEAVLMVIAGWFMRNFVIRLLVKRRKREFRNQFCDYLDSVSTSLAVGKNTYEAFLSADEDMRGMYRADSAICKESAKVTDGLKNGRRIGDVLRDMAADAESRDVMTFAEIYEIGSTAGGNLKTIVDDTRSLLVDKIAVEDEIQTILTGPKNELNIMALMPLIILAALRVLGGSVLEGDSSFLINAAALCIFAGSYAAGRKMVDISV